MIKFADKKVIDNRVVVDIKARISHSKAVVLNNDGTYEEVLYMTDDQRTWSNEAIIDATKEQLEDYRIYKNDIKKGDIIKIIDGRKMKGEIKQVKYEFTYRPDGTYGHQDVDYLVFTDGTKVNKLYCQIVKE